jgi:protein SCO1/2
MQLSDTDLAAQPFEQTVAPGRFERPLGQIAAFFQQGRFAVFALSLLVFYQVFVLVMAFLPATGTSWGPLAEEFRVRCFRYDAKTGAIEWNLVWFMVSEPMLLEGIILLVWRSSLRTLWKDRRRAILPLGCAGLATFAVIAACLFKVGTTEAGPTELPFPGERIRTQLPTPPFALINQDGQTISLDDCRGKVVLVTAVYSTCTTACPMALSQIRRLLDQLSPDERAELVVIALSLNPQQDTRELRTMTVKAYGLAAPQFHFVNGAAAEVDNVLDRLQITRTRDPATGQIEHSTLFFCIDRQGRIAYRLSLNARYQSWLPAALRSLIAEKAS